MASKLLPHSVIKVETTSGYTYGAHYQHPRDSNRPYILFIHGFPSSSYDWRHQVEYFANQGYGIVAPDCLGYGDTDKPLEVEPYKLKDIGDSVVEVLDKVVGKDVKVHGVGHDWGSAVLSRIANFHPERFLTFSFLAGGYTTPGPFDLDTVNAKTKEMLGYSTLGYWVFFNEEDAGPVLDSHQESVVDLLYPSDMLRWKEYVGPVGKIRPWIEGNTRADRASYVTPEEFAIHDAIFAPSNGGYAPALGYYRATIRGHNDSVVDMIPQANKTTELPTLYIGPTADPLIIVPAVHQATKAFAPNMILKTVESGHWPQLEKRSEVNTILQEFFNGAKTQV